MPSELDQWKLSRTKPAAKAVQHRQSTKSETARDFLVKVRSATRVQDNSDEEKDLESPHNWNKEPSTLQAILDDRVLPLKLIAGVLFVLVVFLAMGKNQSPPASNEMPPLDEMPPLYEMPPRPLEDNEWNAEGPKDALVEMIDVSWEEGVAQVKKYNTTKIKLAEIQSRIDQLELRKKVMFTNEAMEPIDEVLKPLVGTARNLRRDSKGLEVLIPSIKTLLKKLEEQYVKNKELGELNNESDTEANDTTSSSLHGNHTSGDGDGLVWPTLTNKEINAKNHILFRQARRFRNPILKKQAKDVVETREAGRRRVREEHAKREDERREQAEREQAEKERAAREEAEREQAKLNRQRAVIDRQQAELNQLARERAEREQPEREQPEGEPTEKEDAAPEPEVFGIV